MPELPEVETIVRTLRTGRESCGSLIGCEFIRIEVLWGRSIAEPDPQEFISRLPGRKIEDIRRRGKYIVIFLDRDYLLIHLRMSGDLRVESYNDKEKNSLLARHDRVAFFFSDGRWLAFNDTRKFGRVWLVSDMESVTGKLGPEPLENSFSASFLFHRLQNTRRQIKALLLDQHFIAGLGNIYTDEALHLAGIHPMQPANSLDEYRVERLHDAIQYVLQEGIKNNGASIDWVYRGGNFQNEFRVYQRSGKPCFECGTQIQRGVISQRGTHFCPNCQPLASITAV
jgi:formamidopyrimidine-DNA glycosylase